MFKDLMLDILFPKLCINCRREGKYVCDKCKLFLSESLPSCPVCGRFSQRGETHDQCISKYSLDGLTSLYDYEGLMKDLIKLIRYQGVTNIIEELIERVNLSYEYIAYIKKEEKIGFNVAEMIAKELVRKKNCQMFDFNKKIKNLILVDDLFEAGENTRDYVRTFKEKGVENIWGFVLAKDC